jgi:hypothetical protein
MCVVDPAAVLGSSDSPPRGPPKMRIPKRVPAAPVTQPDDLPGLSPAPSDDEAEGLAGNSYLCTAGDCLNPTRLRWI